MPKVIDPITNEETFIVDENEISLADLIERKDTEKVSTGRTFQFPNFCILNNDDTYTKTLLIKSQFKNRKGYPLLPKQAISFTGKSPEKIRLKAETEELEVILLFV
ncbi:MAG: hypothetical protein LBU27_09120 [Candidatus Peribacteria bacterium]|nr:hypothetical protein [Candidatus Peribacteria bacterium]